MMAFALLGCQATPTRSPCTDIDCSGAGTCTLAELADEKVPTCLCDPGFAPTNSGWLCLPSTDGSLCAGVTCSGHGTCASVKGKPRCLCEEGYQTSADGTKCADPCAAVTCSGHGSCQRDDTGATCSCDPGYRTSHDGLSCEPEASTLLTYKYIYVPHNYPLGRASVALGPSGVIDERVSYYRGFGWGSGGSLSRKTIQSFVMDSAGDNVVSAEYHDEIRQGKINRRRWGKAAFGPSSVDASFQRLDRHANVSTPFSSTKAPIPMFGGFEYPGWTMGCFSPVFFQLALKRYDKTAGDPQYIDVYWPTSATMSQVRVEVGKGATPQKPALNFPDYGIRVIYATDGYPESMVQEDSNLTWSRTTDALADLNMSDLPTASPFTQTALPTAGTESSVAVAATDGVQLAGTLTVPAAASAPAPAVLMVSDWAGASADAPMLTLPQPLYRHLAAHLAAKGFASLRYAPRGRGKSQGNLEQATLAQLTADAVAALSSLKNQTAVDNTRIFILSHGTGSVTALGLLADPAHKAGIRGYLAIAPLLKDTEGALLYRETEHIKISGFSNKFIKQLEDGVTKPLATIKDGTYTDPTFRGLAVPLWQDLLSFDGSGTLGAFAGPVLALRGDQDIDFSDQLPAAKDAATAAGKANLTTQTLAGLTAMLVPGKSDGLLEEALLPLELTNTALDPILNWLVANK